MPPTSHTSHHHASRTTYPCGQASGVFSKLVSLLSLELEFVWVLAPVHKLPLPEQAPMLLGGPGPSLGVEVISVTSSISSLVGCTHPCPRSPWCQRDRLCPPLLPILVLEGVEGVFLLLLDRPLDVPLPWGLADI